MLATFLINLSTMVLAVMVHYEVLHRLSQAMPLLRVRYRFRIVIGLIGAILAHVLEIWLFAFTYYLCILAGDFGTLEGTGATDLLDCAYFSFITYTTLGYGDIVPAGSLRYLAGLEALTGLVLITWTASFMYYEMHKYWSNQ